MKYFAKMITGPSVHQSGNVNIEESRMFCQELLDFWLTFLHSWSSQTWAEEYSKNLKSLNNFLQTNKKTGRGRTLISIKWNVIIYLVFRWYRKCFIHSKNQILFKIPSHKLSFDLQMIFFEISSFKLKFGTIISV